MQMSTELTSPIQFRISKRGNMKDPQLKSWTTLPNIFLVATTDSGKVVGCIAYKQVNLDTVELGRSSVDKEFRRLGIGQKLLQTVLKTAKENGYEMVLVSTSIAQLHAQKLYEKMNFEFVCSKPSQLHPIFTYLTGLKAVEYKIQINKES